MGLGFSIQRSGTDLLMLIVEKQARIGSAMPEDKNRIVL